MSVRMSTRKKLISLFSPSSSLSPEERENIALQEPHFYRGAMDKTVEGMPAKGWPNHMTSELCLDQETAVQIWDSSREGEQEEVLGSKEVRGKLHDLAPMWDPKSLLDASTAESRRFILITTLGDPSASWAPIQTDRDTLERINQTVGFHGLFDFLCIRQFVFKAQLQFDDDGDGSVPTSLTLLVRYPRNSRSVTLALRLSLRTLHATAFLAAVDPQDLIALRRLCIAQRAALTAHPLHLLSLLYDHSLDAWSDWFTTLWTEVAEIETATNMTRPSWRLRHMDARRLQDLAERQTLQSLLHATNTELCHCDTVLKFAVKHGQWCMHLVDLVESERRAVGATPLARRELLDVGGKFQFATERAGAARDRLMEMRSRLNGQINVATSLIAQKDSKINLAVAQIQARDSGIVKAIAVMTMFFVPITLVTQLWEANLFQLDSHVNIVVYLCSTFGVTLLVVFCWLAYTRRYQSLRGADLSDAVIGRTLDDMTIV